MSDNAAATIKEWMQGLVQTARSGKSFETSAGADSGRAYAYLEYRRADGKHSVLVFAVDPDQERPVVRAQSFEGSADEVREAIERMVPEEDRPVR